MIEDLAMRGQRNLGAGLRALDLDDRYDIVYRPDPGQTCAGEVSIAT